MTPFKFYIWFAIFVESFPVVPVLIAYKNRNRLSKGMQFFLGFLGADLVLNLISNYYYFNGNNNLYLYYFCTLLQSTFILLTLTHFFESKYEKIVSVFLLVINIFILLIDFLCISKNGYNYLSGLLVNIIVFAVSIYYFSKKIIQLGEKKEIFNEVNLIISLIIGLQFFIKAIVIFLEKYILQTQNNVFLWLQVRDIYNYFMLFSLVIYTYVIYNLENDEV